MPMRTLQELAETYERWAADAEALADQIMAGLDTQRKEIQLKKRESAQMFVEEAERFGRWPPDFGNPKVYRSLSPFFPKR